MTTTEINRTTDAQSVKSRAVDLKLEVGAISESVTIKAESEQLRTATASMGQTINTTEARDLPIMGRNTYMLADLATGMYTALNTTSQASGFGRPYDGASAQMSSEGIGSQYQIIHALAIMGVVVLVRSATVNAPVALVAQCLFLAGSVLFPGALYLLAFGGPRWMGAVAPIGGIVALFVGIKLVDVIVAGLGLA